MMQELQVNDDPALIANFSECDRPAVSLLAAQDWDREYHAVHKFDSVHFANEWDGVVAFVSAGSENAQYEAMTARAHPVQLSMKPYPDVIAFAKKKFPVLDWEQVSTMPSEIYVSKLDEVQAALRSGPARVRALDTVVGEVEHGAVATCVTALISSMPLC